MLETPDRFAAFAIPVRARGAACRAVPIVLSSLRNTAGMLALRCVPWRNEMSEEAGETRIPIVEERARIEKHVVPAGLVRIQTSVSERIELLSEELTAQTVTVERVRIDREVDAPPGIRREGEVLIIPVVEQRLVVEKRWVLTEELHVHRQQHTEVLEVPVGLRSTRVSVEREDGGSGSAGPSGEIT
jgi:uncharacterized protein (TIGR02271 family)